MDNTTEERIASLIKKGIITSKPRLIFCIDVDGTVIENLYAEHTMVRREGVGAPLSRAAEVMAFMGYLGHTRILWTCRKDEQECRKHLASVGIREGVHYDLLNENKPSVIEAFGGDNRKVFGNYYIDDRNFGVDMKTLWADVYRFLCEYDAVEPGYVRLGVEA